MLVETDALLDANAIKHEATSNSCFDMVIAYCVILLNKILDCHVFCVRRSVNEVVHALVRVYVSMSEHNFIVNVLNFDYE